MSLVVSPEMRHESAKPGSLTHSPGGGGTDETIVEDETIVADEAIVADETTVADETIVDEALE